MNLLSILCIGNQSSVSIMINGKIKDTYKTDEEFSHSKALPTYIDRLIKENKISLLDFDGIAISIGPGSYTGLRIGLSLAKGLAFSHDIPIIPISSFDILDYSIKNKKSSYWICIHSHKNLFFSQKYDKSKITKGPILLNISDIKNETTYYSGRKPDLYDSPFHSYCNLDSETIITIAKFNFNSLKINDINSISPLYITDFTIKND